MSTSLGSDREGGPATPSRPASTRSPGTTPPPGPGASAAAEADIDAGVDHVWANVRVFLPTGPIRAACQLGGDRLLPHLGRFAGTATTAGTASRSGFEVPGAPDSGTLPPAAFDLVAVEDLGRAGRPPREALAEAIRLCGPAGTVVVGYRPWRLPPAVRRAIAERSAGRMSALPSTKRPAFLLDPAHRRSARYFVRRMAFAYRAPGSSGITASLRALMSGAARAVPSRVAMAASPARIAAIAGPQAPTPILAQLEDLVRSSWTSFGLTGPAPEALEPLVVGHRRPSTGIVTVLLFPSRGGEPVVAKLPRYGGSDPALGREDRALRLVSDAVTAPVREEIPRSLGVHRLDDLHVLLQTGMPGHHLVARVATGRLRPRRTAAQLDLVLSWCTRLQASSAHTREVDDELIGSRLEPLAAAALAALGGDRHVASLLDRTLEDARHLRGTAIPMVVAHGDYWAGNILTDGDRVAGVVDWERATVDDLPIWDPVKAVGSAAYHLDRYRSVPRRGPGGLPAWGDLGPWAGLTEPRFATGFRAAFVDPSWLSEAAQAALTRTFTQARIPMGWLPVGVTFYLVHQIVQAGDAPRSIAGWGSVLRALALWPGTWADAYAPPRRPRRAATDTPPAPTHRPERTQS